LWRSITVCQLSAIRERSELNLRSLAERRELRQRDTKGVIVVKKEQQERAAKERKEFGQTYSIHWVDTIAVTSSSQKSST
jgi:hypothetical protein